SFPVQQLVTTCRGADWADRAAPRRVWRRSGAGFELGQARGGHLGDLAGGRLPRLGVGAARLGLLQRLVDELAERDVALLDADAVRLLAEGVAGQLEGAV